LKIILRLLLNDLKRDWKRPWSMLLFAALPLALSVLIVSVFGGRRGAGPLPTIQVAVLDQDKDMLSRILRSFSGQGEAAQHLRLHFVETRDEGLRMVENGKASALVVLPEAMTEGLLNGQTNSIELYENPAEQVLPKIVRQGVLLLALGLSSASETLGEPLRDIRRMINSDDFPAEQAVSAVSSDSVRRLSGFRTYLFPPLIRFETVPAAEFQPFPTNTPTPPLTNNAEEKHR
jgi:hypothetical protein